MNTTAGARLALCSGERFATQQSLAECSAILIDENVAITAAHCLDTVNDCRDFSYLLGYHLNESETLVDEPGTRTLECSGVVFARRDELDFAVLFLRPAGPEITINPRIHIGQGEPIVNISAGLGLPLKVSDGYVLEQMTTTQFRFRADVYRGGSGSGLFDRSGHLVGMVIGGEQDFRVDGNCRKTNHIVGDASIRGDAGMPAEEATAILPILQALCSALPSRPICNTL
ncbi:MAG TPA: serine protease, partial [Polyangiaceae bacterium]|nr:serine protease [Polyangiaceae bacterium]